MKGDLPFQSTRPVRGATSDRHSGTREEAFQSTRPVRGATCTHNIFWKYHFVSIHAPRAGRDLFCLCRSIQTFVSIHAPRAGRDDIDADTCYDSQVSIHAPRAGRDFIVLFVP